MAENQGTDDVFGSLGQYRIVVDELKANKPTSLEDGAYNRLLAVAFELPFQFPWPPNPQSTLLQDSFVTFRFRQDTRAIESTFGHPTTYTITNVTAITPANRWPDPTPEVLSNVFDWMLEHLNDLLLAYAVVTKDGQVQQVTHPMLSVGALWGYIEPYAGHSSVEGMLLLNPFAVPYEKLPPPDETLRMIAAFKLQFTALGYPFLTSWQLRIEGEQHLFEGRYTTAAILISSAFEARANELLRYFYWKAGRTPDELEQKLHTPFVRRLKREYHTHLGGNFDLESPGPLRHWLNTTHRLRNRVVHGGYRPDRLETVHASVAMVQAWDYLMSLVRTKTDQYTEMVPFVQLGGEKFFWPPRYASPN